MIRTARHCSLVLGLLICGLFCFPLPAWAYLDPGTGSMILQGVIGGIAAAVVLGKLYWHRLLRFLKIKKDE